jgi:hypothetical protein
VLGRKEQVDKKFIRKKKGNLVIKEYKEDVLTLERVGRVIDLVCDSQYCLYDSLYLFCRCLHCKMHVRCVLNDVSSYTVVKCPKYPRKERASLQKNTRGRETLEIKITEDRGYGLR